MMLAHPGTRGIRPGRRSRAAAAGTLALTVLAASLAACGGGSSNGLGRLTVTGVVQYASAHGTLHPTGSGQVLRAGDLVQVTSGTALIRLVPDGVVELRAGTAVTVDEVPRLTAGDVLIEPAAHPLRVSSANATLVVPAGAAQLAMNAGLDGGLTAKVYRDRSSLQIEGNPSLAIAAPREALLKVTSRLPIPATPLRYDDTDAWDRRYLATVEAFSRQLTAAATGFNAQLPSGQTHDAVYYQRLLPELMTSVVAESLQGQAPAKPGDDLIALAMAMRGRRGAFGDRLRQELAFKADGADWGLVSVDQGISDLGQVLNDVLAAIDRASLPFTAPGSGQVAFGPLPPLAAPAATPTTRPRPGARTTPATVPAARTPTPAQFPSPSTTVAPIIGHLPKTGTPLDPLLGPLIDPLIDLLNRILGH